MQTNKSANLNNQKDYTWGTNKNVQNSFNL